MINRDKSSTTKLLEVIEHGIVKPFHVDIKHFKVNIKNQLVLRSNYKNIENHTKPLVLQNYDGSCSEAMIITANLKKGTMKESFPIQIVNYIVHTIVNSHSSRIKKSIILNETFFPQYAKQSSTFLPSRRI